MGVSEVNKANGELASEVFSSFLPNNSNSLPDRLKKVKKLIKESSLLANESKSSFLNSTLENCASCGGCRCQSEQNEKVIKVLFEAVSRHLTAQHQFMKQLIMNIANAKTEFRDIDITHSTMTMFQDGSNQIKSKETDSTQQHSWQVQTHISSDQEGCYLPSRPTSSLQSRSCDSPVQSVSSKFSGDISCNASLDSGNYDVNSVQRPCLLGMRECFVVLERLEGIEKKESYGRKRMVGTSGLSPDTLSCDSSKRNAVELEKSKFSNDLSDLSFDLVTDYQFRPLRRSSLKKSRASCDLSDVSKMHSLSQVSLEKKSPERREWNQFLITNENRKSVNSLEEKTFIIPAGEIKKDLKLKMRNPAAPNSHNIARSRRSRKSPGPFWLVQKQHLSKDN